MFSLWRELALLFSYKEHDFVLPGFSGIRNAAFTFQFWHSCIKMRLD